MEIWKDIPGYEGLYQVSNMGRVKSLDRWIEQKDPRGNYLRPFPGKAMKPFYSTQRYLYVTLSDKYGKRGKVSVHILVLRSFVGECPHKYQCNHLNGKRDDNRLENLEYCTRSDNLKHSYKVLRRPKGGVIGENHHKAKLNNSDVIEIRKLYKTNKYPQTRLAKMFNVRQTTISNIVNGIGWKHLVTQ